MVRGLAPVLLASTLAACGGAPYSGSYAMTRASGGSDDYAAQSPSEAQQPRYAQAEQGGQDVRTDATSIPLLIYTAELGMAVHGVTAKEDRVEEIAHEIGGFLASRTDDTIVIRVPSREFQHAMALIQEVGDVLTRRIDVQDVTEEFRDIETRIHTLEAMRQRVEQLLRDAHDVEAALAVEQHLERITVQLEQLRGRLRFLSDRVAFSTITVRFQERADSTEPGFRLPFGWLRLLGLQRLLEP